MIGMIMPAAHTDIVVFDRARRVTFSYGRLRVGCAPYEAWEVQWWPVLTMIQEEAVAENGAGTAEPGTGRHVREVNYERA